MRITSPALILASAILAAAAFTPNTASAATVRVPFNFSAAGKTMPAGVYSIHRDNLGEFVSLDGPGTKTHRSWVLGPGDAAPASGDVKATFVKTDAGYELRSIQYHELTTGRLDKSKQNDSATRVLRGE